MKKEKEAKLLELKQDLEFYKDAIKTIANEIIDNEVSHFPVFIAHKEPIELGRKVLDAEEFEAKWDISASLLEEFVAKGLVEEDKLDEFKAAFKDAKIHMCVFAADTEIGNFIFLPY